MGAEISFCIEQDEKGNLTCGVEPEDAEDEAEGPETGKPDAEDKAEGAEPDEEVAEKSYMKPVKSLDIAFARARKAFGQKPAAAAAEPDIADIHAMSFHPS